MSSLSISPTKHSVTLFQELELWRLIKPLNLSSTNVAIKSLKAKISKCPGGSSSSASA